MNLLGIALAAATGGSAPEVMPEPKPAIAKLELEPQVEWKHYPGMAAQEQDTTTPPDVFGVGAVGDFFQIHF